MSGMFWFFAASLACILKDAEMMVDVGTPSFSR
jgi:hypothetical protein